MQCTGAIHVRTSTCCDDYDKDDYGNDDYDDGDDDIACMNKISIVWVHAKRHPC